jgi:hypothetical protein
LVELLAWIAKGDHRPLLSNYGQVVNERLVVPTRFLVGSQDPLTPPRNVRETFMRIGSRLCEYVEIGRDNGFSRDYRHLDTLLGQEVRREVAPLVTDWLEVGLSQQIPRLRANA